jgi:radical SAM protein with 4Fe4S-binding SPASM domain
MANTSQLARVLRNAAEQAIPHDVVLELTHRCNFRCDHCYVACHEETDRLPTPRILDLLDELADLGTLYLTVSGGEPLLREDWLAVVRRARERGFRVRLFTNGSLVDRAVARALADLFVAVEVTMYSTSETVFDRLTGTAGSFVATRRGIDALAEAGVEFVLKTPLLAENLDDASAVHELAARLGVLCRTDPRIVHHQGGSTLPLRHRLDEETLVPYYSGANSGLSCASLLDDGSRDSGPLCAAGNRHACITARGDVLPCNVFPVSAGNVTKESFRAIWEGSHLLRTVRSITRSDLPTCKGCSRLAFCGRCHAQALVEDGDILGPSAWACEHAATLERVFAPGK